MLSDKTPTLQLLQLDFRLDRPSEFRFFHDPTVYAFLHERFRTRERGGAFARGCRLLACESGRVHYQAGDGYHIALALTPNAQLTSAQVIRCLKQPSADRRGNKPLNSRTRLVASWDLVIGARQEADADATWLSLGEVRAAARQLPERRRLRVTLDSALLILRAPVTRRDTFMDDRVFSPEVFMARVKRSMEEWFPELTPQTDLPQVTLTDNALARAETHYHGSRGVKVMPGARGSVELEFARPMPEEWAVALLLAGAVGIGKGTDMGRGRFSVQGHPLHPNWPPPPASTLVDRMLRAGTLDQAREAMLRAGETPGVDDVERQDFLDSLTYRQALLQKSVKQGVHKASPLRGLLLQKAGGGIRPLAIPTMEERFLQRACAIELGPAIDELLEESSFAYRRGLSRHNAEYSVRTARDEGYHHVLEADLHAFFDEVDWSLLERRLRAYFGRDPIVDLMMAWVRAPVEFAERLIQRDKGLPQGAVISPLLANLYLDPFDEAITARGFRLVRYADDFVILCKSAQQVDEARRAVEEELTRLRLRLAEGKTAASTFERGFEFLGFLFCKSLSLQTKKQRLQASLKPDRAEVISQLAALDAEAARGWLSAFLNLDTREPPAPHWRPSLAPRSPERRSVYVVEPGLKICGGRRGLRLYKNKTLVGQHAWPTLAEVVVLGGHFLSSGATQHAMRYRVPISVYTRSGKALGVILPERVRMPSAVTREHWRWHETAEARLGVAKELIGAKIRNQRLLVRHQPGHNDRLRDQLKSLGAAVERAQTPNRVRGLEGQAAHAYFSHWAGWLTAAPRQGEDSATDVLEGPRAFRGRTGRGAQDPVNAVLNLLYTQLFRRCHLALIAQGLDGHLGVLHEGGERYACLAADMQEPFRFLCERLALELFHRRMLRREDFVYNEKSSPPLLIQTEALKRILSEWEKRLQARVSAGGQTKSYGEHISEQAVRLKRVILGERASLGAFELKW